MPSYSLRLRVPASISRGTARATFYWALTGRDSFWRSCDERPLGPSLGVLGPVAQANVEFVRLAATVYAADRSTPRAAAGVNWSQRELALTVPVWQPDRWEPIADRLAGLLGFLSGDDWSLTFTRSPSPREPTRKLSNEEPAPARVLLLSGGADSAVGALVSRHELGDAPQSLVSHFAAPFLPGVQRATAASIGALLPGRQRHHVIRLSRRSTQPNGLSFADEFSTRSRSLLFIALGLAVASIHEAPLWVSENGFASLNPPLSADRLGSLSTRTTHPYFLETLRALLSEAGAHADFTNPFQDVTKGEMFRQAADLVGNDEASRLLSSTLSCAHTGHRAFGYPLSTGCGVCFGCLVRKAAFAAAGLEDQSAYLPQNDPRLERYLADKSIKRPLRAYVERGIRAVDIAAMTLPPSYAPRAAYDLCQRAAQELRLLFP